MDYKITSTNSNTGQIEVEYFHQGTSVGIYCIDVPIVDGKYIDIATLDIEIKARAPHWEVERRAILSSAPDFSHIEALAETKFVDSEIAQSNAAMWATVQKEQEIAAILVKFGLLKEDPTKIGVTKL